MNYKNALQQRSRHSAVIIAVMVLGVLILAFACLFAGSSGMSVPQALNALAGRGTPAQMRILWNIRVPRFLSPGGLHRRGRPADVQLRR